MADRLTAAQRQHCMSRVKAKDTKPEMRLRRALWAKGLRYRKHAKLPGKPDIVFPSRRLAVFIDGCFWHACPEHGSIPKTNKEFWKKKIYRTVERDQENVAALESLG